MNGEEELDFRNEIKKYDIITMEDIIKEAFSKLTGEEMTCDINNIKYGISDVEFNVRISRKSTFFNKT